MKEWLLLGPQKKLEALCRRPSYPYPGTGLITPARDPCTPARSAPTVGQAGSGGAGMVWLDEVAEAPP
jgi:hypothetical protein